jgi:tRNA (cmo5U34)-methyltransferase
MADFEWDPEGFLALMLEEIPDYVALQEQVAAATGSGAARVLELGTGTGETAARVLPRHPGARYVGVDSSAEMLARARERLGDVTLHDARLQDPLPAGEFDLVVSVLAVHHLDGPGKADLFARVASALADGGRFVLGDLVVPDDPADVQTEIDGVYDLPSRLDEQVGWLRDAGLDVSVPWARRDLAVIVARKLAH